MCQTFCTSNRMGLVAVATPDHGKHLTSMFFRLRSGGTVSLRPIRTKLDKAWSSACPRMGQLAWSARQTADAVQKCAVLISSWVGRLSQIQVDTE